MISQNRRLTMKDNQAKYPQLRFKGFTDPWEERKLEDIFLYKQGQQVPVENQFTKPGKHRHRFIRIVDLTTTDEEPRYIEYSGRNTISATDLFMIRYGQPGVIGYGYEGVIANNLFKLIPKVKANNRFFKYRLDSMYPKIQSLSSSTTMPAISFKSLDVLDVRYPDIKEQEKIGAFFKQLDDTITLHQRKLTKLKELKQGYLQKLFPKNGSKFPQLRFTGFADAWEERKLKDVVEKQIKGKAQFEKLAPGEVEYLDTSRLNGGQAILTNGLKDVTLDDILILWDGSKAGTVYHGFEGALGSTLKAYRTSANSKFVYQYLKRHQDNIYNNYRTPNIPHVQKDFLNVFTISVPMSDEQEKIGSFFKQLDDTITLHQRKLEKLQELKKGYLQKMFC